jgi:hypothetical protein
VNLVLHHWQVHGAVFKDELERWLQAAARSTPRWPDCCGGSAPIRQRISRVIAAAEGCCMAAITWTSEFQIPVPVPCCSAFGLAGEEGRKRARKLLDGRELIHLSSVVYRDFVTVT